MVPAKTPGKVIALRVGLWELLIVLSALIFVRKEVYLAGQFKSMFLHWQEYVLLVLMFVDGVLRGFGEVQGKGHFLSPFRKRSMCFWLPFTLFLFVSCASLCDKMNWACVRQEWWRDTGLLIVILGVVLSAWEQRTRPQQLEAEMVPRTFKEVSEPKLSTACGALEIATIAKFYGSGQNPKSISEQSPGGGNEQSPGSDSKQSPESGDEQSLGGGNEQSLGGSNKQSPSGGSEQSPSGGSEQSPSGGSEQSPGGGSEQSPESGSEPDIGNDKHYAEIKVEGPWNLLRYPDRSSILLELIGISFVLSAWMPLLTLPGLIVAFKWELADVEAFRISQFGKKYLNYKEKTWFLIPYIY